ncbi:PIR Superfamily Protein [Plasmodium ovale wallikeri]|uniref:PIR Superfamily Protein n=2 Tax=Plasmodium ovale TaxID=36330 RepID=A0A1A9ALP4_PLAOA|nr:PIR Superfamily Protein [Plasmodium ovale wallikeri]SBT57132.1 PIR Superfamily Protein [Plasmodium ovale wallikeri]SBT73756.1 Plasmodium vivax Vir protein, putative [Plasmodium ovale]
MAVEDSEITSLHSNVIYYQLDKASKIDLTDDDTYWNVYIKNSNIQYSRNSTAFLNVFYYIKKLDTDEIFYSERWNYLYFWLGLKLLENSEKSKFHTVMEALHTVRSSNTETADKYNDDMFNIDTEEFMNLKKIYDYLQNYKSIIARIDYPDAPCTPAYKNYVTTTFNFYKEEKRKCTQKGTDNYCKVVNRFISEYEKNIKKLTCTGQSSPETHEAEDLADSGQELSSPEYGRKGVHLPFGQEERARGMSHPGGDVSPSSGSTNALSTVFPVLGTASLAFFFLKFTPLGSRVRGTIFRKHMLQSNDEEAQEILENSYEFAPTNVEDTAHHIAYHRM